LDAEKTLRTAAGEDPEAKEPIEQRDRTWSFGGGFFIRNMWQIGLFDSVSMQNMKGDCGGCIRVTLDPNFRKQGYNQESYNFTNLSLAGCLAVEDGGGF
jgi:hypothetical protein